MRRMSRCRYTIALRSLRFLGLPLLLSAALPRPSAARIINVPASQPTLQAAAAAAASGDTILFAPGTYTGGVWIENKTIVAASRFLTTGDTTFIAQTVLTGTVSNVCNGASGCTGDAIFEFDSHCDGSAVIGLTLTNAVKGVRTSSITDVDHCHAIGMVLAGDGVNYLPGSGGTISNSLFMNNRDDGIDLNGEMDVTVVNNIVRDNWDDGIEFRMYPWAGPTLSITITGNQFLNNGSDGIQLIDSPDSSHREVRIERNLFQGNQKATVGCMGNQQTQEDYSGSPLGEHVVFANNTCVDNFYGVCGGANSVVINNIFMGTTNSALRRIGGNSICAYNLLWSNGLNYESSTMDLAHTLIADPQLDASHRLTSGSPAIDYGMAFYQWRGQTILNLPPSSYSGARPDLGAFELGGAPSVNAAPAVSAGPAQTLTLPADAILDGTVSDDGMPNPPGLVTTTWSLASGPASVTFQNASSVDTRATFTTAGTYLLRLTANDGALSTSATVQITVQAGSSAITIDRRVAAGSDDAEEGANGTLLLSSSDLELVFDGTNQWIGLRFTNLAIPRGTTIGKAYLQFEAKETQSEATSITILAQAADNAATFSTSSTVSARPRTTAQATWAPPAWSVVGEAGANQRTTDVSAVIQQVVNRTGWTSGNALVLIMSGTGHRTAWSFEGKPASAALLHIEAGTAPPPPPPPTNAAPVVGAGPGQTITLPADAVLDGTVSDDGLPNPPGATTTTWSMSSGPGAVTFLNPAAVDTRATFAVAGTYALRLTASDGELSSSATVQVTVQPAPTGTTTVERRVAAGTDDAEESSTGSMQLGSSDLELVFDVNTNQWVGMRFTNVAIPRGANIISAYLQFEAKEVQSEATNLTVRAQATDNATTFSFTDKVSTRTRTAAQVAWAPAAWTVVNEASAVQRTSDFSAVVQEVVNRPGWVSGNAMAMVIDGTGHRTAWAFEGKAAGAPLLHIEYGTAPPPPPPPVNAAPQVDAGPDQLVTLPSDAALDGTVSDDGLPDPPANVATNWTEISGPASVDFQNSSAVDTRVAFTVPGDYLLRLTASDGALAASDSVRITVTDVPPPTNAAPVVSVGAAQTITLPADAILEGAVSDDGLPNPPGALTTTWSMSSGPAAVSFENLAAVSTRATFTVAGTYVLRLAASDGAATTTASVLITVQPAPTTATTLERRIAAGTDDAEESPTGSLQLASSDIELVFDISTNQWVGLRFANVTLPRGAAITRAYIQFEADEIQNEPTNLLFQAEASDNAVTFSFTSKVASRPRTTASAGWAPVDWDLIGEAGGNQRSPDLSAVIQEVVNRPGWVSGNALAIVVSGTGHRTARAFEGVPAGAALLHIEAGGTPPPPPPPPTNVAPVVDAGPAQAITLPAEALLDGTVTDDGLPNPPGAVTTNWTLISGPGSVAIQDPAAVDTRVAFSVAGTYLLRLTAGDTQLSTSDSVLVTVEPAPSTNTAPTVSAGPPQTITLPADAYLDGTVSDDGLPNPPAALTTGWSLSSGPALVTFQNAGDIDTRATFSAPGTYLLRLTANDGSLSSSATVQVTVQQQPPSAYVVVDRRIVASSDDAEESSTGTLFLNSSDLELVNDGGNQWVGMRFTNVGLARNAPIGRAYIQFDAAGVQSEATTLTIRGQAADNAATFSTSSNVSSRSRTTASPTWAPVAWSVLNEAGANQRTVDLSPVIQEVVNRPGWSSGNAIVILINGTGHRTAWAFEGKSAGAPLLHIESGTPPPNTAPVVDAGAAQTIMLPADAILDGTVTDDGQPSPPAVTTTWTASGPGPVTFQSAGSIDTRATFTAAGAYMLRLTASDGALTARDSVQITVRPAPVTLERRVAASSDDAEEEVANGPFRINSSDLELVNDGNDQSVGMRFTGLSIPPGATISRAYLQFTTSGAQTTTTSLTLRAEAADNPITFSVSSKVAARPRGAASTSWAPVAWNVVGEASASQRTPELAALIQEVVNRPGWASGNALVIFVDGTGRRSAYAFDGNAAAAPLLHVEYQGTEPASAPSARASLAAPEFAPLPAPRAEFALRGLYPNPTHGPLRVDFSLADLTPASLDVLDVMGRRIVRRELGSPGPGWHVLELRETLPPGLYVVRLVQGSRVGVRKAMVVR